jgi:hypothetical protein
MKSKPSNEGALLENPIHGQNLKKSNIFGIENLYSSLVSIFITRKTTIEADRYNNNKWLRKNNDLLNEKTITP